METLYCSIVCCANSSESRTRRNFAVKSFFNNFFVFTKNDYDRNGKQRIYTPAKCIIKHFDFYTWHIQSHLYRNYIYTLIFCNPQIPRLTEGYNKKHGSQVVELLIRMSLVRVQLPEPRIPRVSGLFVLKPFF